MHCCNARAVRVQELLERAVSTALAARESWDAMPLEERCAIFLRAADLCTTKYKSDLCATTMLGQGALDARHCILHERVVSVIASTSTRTSNPSVSVVYSTRDVNLYAFLE